MADNVNHPSHYETGKYECIDVMLETQGYIATLGFCICNVFKYTYRHGGKNGREDIEKAGWYRNKYLELLDHVDEYITDVDGVLKDLSKILPHAEELINEPKSHVAKLMDGEVSNDYKQGTSPDIQAIREDISKFFDSVGMNPPIKEDPRWVHPEDFIPVFCPGDTSFVVPDGLVLETRLSKISDNGTIQIWKAGTKVSIISEAMFGYTTDRTNGEYACQLRITDVVTGTTYIKTVARMVYRDASDFKEKDNG